MAWTASRTWTTGELVTAAIMNTHVRDNFNATSVALVTTKGDLTPATGATALERLGVGSNNQSIIADSACNVGMKWGDSRVLIQDINLTSASATINFTSIPATFKHLELVVHLRTTNTADELVDLEFNGASGNGHDFLRVTTDKTTGVVTAEGLAQAKSQIFAALKVSSPSSFEGNIIEIINYTASGMYKSYCSHGQSIRGTVSGTIFKTEGAGLWRSASVINRITLTPNSGCQFSASSRATLYGK